MFSAWRNLIMLTALVVTATSASFSIAAPKTEDKAIGEKHGTVRLALNKKKSKKQKSQAKHSKKASRPKEAKPLMQESRWQAPAQKADPSEASAWVPKKGGKTTKTEASRKPKRQKKTAGNGGKKPSKHQAKAKSKPTEAPKSAPKAPVVSITPPETNSTKEVAANERAEERVTEPTAPEPTPKPKSAPKKGLSAKSLKAQKRPPMADIEAGPDHMSDGDSNAGASFLMLLTFLVASAGTFVYFKRREELAKVVRQPATKPVAATPAKAKPASRKPDRIPVSTPADAISLAPTTSDMPPELATTALIPSTEPCSFERFAEMQVALSCWIEKGGDAMSSMQTYFNLTESEWLAISAYWNQRYLADDELIRQFNNLAPDYRAKYGGSAA